MIKNKDRCVRDGFIQTLKRLKLKDTPEEDGLFVLNATNSNFVVNSSGFIDVDPTLYHKDSVSVDDEGKVFLSDRDIDRIAQRVIDLLKKERLM